MSYVIISGITFVLTMACGWIVSALSSYGKYKGEE